MATSEPEKRGEMDQGTFANGEGEGESVLCQLQKLHDLITDHGLNSEQVWRFREERAGDHDFEREAKTLILAIRVATEGLTSSSHEVREATRQWDGSRLGSGPSPRQTRYR